MILFLLLVEINCQMNPPQRHRHTATLIDNKLYILGGDTIGEVPDEEIGNGFFYLDFSVKFDTQNLLWQNLSSINTIPPHYGAASVKGGANNSTLFLYGGNSIEMTSLVYTFDPQSNTWTTPKITGVDPIRKYDLKGIINNNGKMYLWGGWVNSGGITNDMLILDTINLSWRKGSLVGAPSPRSSYGAVLLPDRKIIYMGKQELLVMLVLLFTIPYNNEIFII
jgi:N-acetylneuraminic acid mutarotase